MLRVNHLEAVSCNLVNDSAEKAVLGILIRFPETLSRADELREADFCLENARFVLRAVQELRAENAAIDFITVSERAAPMGRRRRISPSSACRARLAEPTWTSM